MLCKPSQLSLDLFGAETVVRLALAAFYVAARGVEVSDDLFADDEQRVIEPAGFASYFLGLFEARLRVEGDRVGIAIDDSSWNIELLKTLFASGPAVGR